MEKPEFFNANLYKLMADKGWSLKKLAFEAKVSYHTVFRAISKGMIPRGSTQQKLAEALDVSVSDLHAAPIKLTRKKSIPLHHEIDWRAVALVSDAYLDAEREPERQLLALYILTDDDKYLKEYVQLPGSPRISAALKKTLSSS